MNLFRMGVAAVMIVMGLTGCFCVVLELIDPVATKMSDDDDAIGAPHTGAQSSILLAVWATVFGIGIWLISRSPK